MKAQKSKLGSIIGAVEQQKMQCLALCLQPAADFEPPAKTFPLLKLRLENGSKWRQCQRSQAGRGGATLCDLIKG